MTAPNATAPHRSWLFGAGLASCAIAGLVGVLAPGWMTALADLVTGPVFDHGGRLLLALVTLFLLASLTVALGPWGRLRLGDAPPEFSTPSWLAMLFCAGMGLGLVYFGVTEPLLHYAHPPVGDGLTPAAARAAIALATVNWGVHSWGIFALSGVTLAWFVYRRGAPLLAGAPIRSAFPGRVAAGLGGAADLLALLAIAFGVAGSIAMAVLQFRAGVGRVFGAGGDSTAVALAVVTVLVAVTCVSAATGVHRGIKWLSNANVALALVMLAGVALLGPTGEIVRSLGRLLVDLPATTFALTVQAAPYDQIRAWTKPWTLTDQIWFVAWAPFVAVFIARISRGRSLRALIFGVLLLPTLLAALWFSVFGTSAIVLAAETDTLVPAVAADWNSGAFALFGTLPGGLVWSGLTLLLLLLFTVTSVDSATVVLAMLVSDGAAEPPIGRRLLWGISLGSLAAGLLLADRLEVLRAVAIAGALPFVVILVVYLVALIVGLRRREGPSTGASRGR